MECALLSHSQSGGWSEHGFPPLDSNRTLILVFGASSYIDDQAPLKQLRAAYPKSTLVGCSSAGEIQNDRLIDESLVVAAVRFDAAQVRAASASVESAAESFDAGRSVARELAGPGLRGVLVYSDGLRVNGSELVRGLSDSLPDGVVLSGGLAADGDRFERTWTFDGDECRPGRVCAVGLYGESLRIGQGSQGGWDIFGPERIVTRSSGAVLYEVDGRPALDLYKEYLGDRANGLPAAGLLFPLALRSNRDDESWLVRTILGVDEQERSMTFAGDIPQGATAQLMRANFDRLIAGAANSALETRTEGDTGPCLSIAVSCVGRRLVLGERIEEELEATLDELPEQTQQLGFYSYGEISTRFTGCSDLHNQTMTLTTITEQS
ncbi:MAG: hypothetical protein EA376_09360 [Phycisphaeraceae bacterium]|nr:MAG: hypothetical protein EA376_09360 [Phycisphaeraceae bacterium]